MSKKVMDGVLFGTIGGVLLVVFGGGYVLMLIAIAATWPSGWVGGEMRKLAPLTAPGKEKTVAVILVLAGFGALAAGSWICAVPGAYWAGAIGVAPLGAFILGRYGAIEFKLDHKRAG